MLSVLAALPAFSPPRQAGSVPFDASTHVAGKSSGCGKSSPYSLGKSSTVTAKYDGVTWTYRIYVPKTYSSNTALPLILQVCVYARWCVSVCI